MGDVERITPDDAVSLATDVGAVPMQVGAVLALDGRLDPVAFADRLTERLPAVPRLRQRLQRAPVGAGRPVWVDDERFDLDQHLSVVEAAARDLDTLMELATQTICRPLDRSRPLWRITLVHGLDHDRSAAIVAFHHVLADGIGGLAVLASLVDRPDPIAPVRRFPVPPPGTTALLRDAARQRAGHLAHPGAGLRRVRDALVQLRPSGSSAERSTLNRPTGAHRRLLTVEVPLGALHRAARAQGATINDALLTAVGGALGDLLVSRGESVGELVISVPMSARREASATTLGNDVGAVPVRVPVNGPAGDRLVSVGARTARARRTTRASSTAIIGPVFRLLARIGIFGWFVDHQRLVHTFVTNLRGPDRALTLLGTPITEVRVVAMITGNVTASFAALSYAGTMGVTVIVDPDACPDADLLRDFLQRQLDALCALAG